MHTNKLKLSLTKIVIILPLLVTILLGVFTIIFIKQKQSIVYDTQNIEIVEVKLPSVDLAKYKLLDKIN